MNQFIRNKNRDYALLNKVEHAICDLNNMPGTLLPYQGLDDMISDEKKRAAEQGWPVEPAIQKALYNILREYNKKDAEQYRVTTRSQSRAMGRQ